jgi:hypothetical protein
MFLKSNRVNQSFDGVSTSYKAFETTAKLSTSNTSDNPKSILRDRNFGDPLLKGEVMDKHEGVSKLIDIDEDKKSVR